MRWGVNEDDGDGGSEGGSTEEGWRSELDEPSLSS